MKEVWKMIGIAALVCASCGGSDGDDESSDGDDSAPAEEAGIDTDGSIDELDACALLSSDEVAAAVGFEVETASSDNTLNPECTFELASDGRLDIELSVIESTGTVHDRYVSSDGSVALSGIAAGGVYAPAFRTVSVDMGGGRYFSISVTGGFSGLEDPGDELTELAELVATRL